MTTTIAPALVPADVTRLDAAIARIRANTTETVLAAAMPSMGVAERATLADHTYFTHAAVVVFPSTLAGLGAELGTGVMTPSVVVRGRLSARYGIPVDDLDVGILRTPVTNRAGRPCELEIFAVATPPELAHIAEDERSHNRESHFALAVPDADSIILNGLRRSVGHWMRPDGGGYNQHENSTVLYFRDTHHALPEFRRLELISRGRFDDVLTDHQRESAAGTRLLHLLTGAWATQAIAAAAELRLADHLATGSDLAALAVATGAERDSLGRLLRYLASLGIVRATASGYQLTDVGTLLRSDVDGSIRPLALLYGGPFYQSFAALTEAVRTGEESYAKVFGAHHSTHMAADPALAELFHQSMAASNAVFAELTRVVDFTGTVVDVAGGNGALLARILDANPDVNGVLLERPHALATARSILAPVADRCELVAGDFTETVPVTGDTYLLSRVLHNWDDQRCHAILTTIAAAMPDGAELLVVERLLTDSDTDSLAVPWDVHMLCNVGGRERTEAHYRALLADAGFELTTVTPLPLDMYALQCVLGP